MQYQYPSWSVFLFKRFNFIFDFHRDDEDLKLSFGRSNFTVSISGLPRDIELIEGFIWSDITLKIKDQHYTFKILNRHLPDQFKNVYREHVTDWYKEKADKIRPKLLKLYEEVKVFLLPTQYIRTSTFKEFMKDKQSIKLNIAWMYEFCSDDDSATLKKLQKFFEDPFHSFERANDRFIEVERKRYESVISSLNESQQKACIINDDTNIVLAGAGTGKTKTLEIRTNYLIQSGRYAPEEILLIAFGSDAKEELIARVGKPNKVQAVTFHGFGRAIVEGSLGYKVYPDKIAKDEKKLRKFVDDEVQRLLNEDDLFVDLVVTYFDDFLFPYKNPFGFDSLGEYYEYIKTNEIRAFSTDTVRSYEEVNIANFLYRNGIKFDYERMYPGDISKSGFPDYHPDFYLPEYDIYIEHFGVNENLIAPKYMNPERYKEGIYKKRQIHNDNGTDLIETFSYMQSQGRLLKHLKDELIERNVVFKPIPKDEYLEDLKELGAIRKLAELAANAIKLSRTMNHNVETLRASLEGSGNMSLLAAVDVLAPLLNYYENYLEEQGTVDFNTMINNAIGIIKTTNFECPYKVIMVDEYQDMSGPRADILMALKERDPELVIYGVGDDRQAIFRFTGADLSLTYDFFNKFGAGKDGSLDETYRFNDKVNKVATRFITENELQNKKEFKAKSADDARVHIVKTSEKEQEDTINNVIDWISENYGACSILLLNRYLYKKPSYLSELKRSCKVKGINIDFNTCHASKGKEADFVILMDMEKGKNGFPSEKISHPLIEFLLPKLESFKDAEERRLFYVALTRTKERVFILSNEENCSEFVKEIRKYGKKYIDESTIEPSQLALNVTDELCPKCETGRVVKRGKGGFFSTCSNDPYCDYKINNCKSCGGPRLRVGEVYVCIDDTCNSKTPACPKCNGDLRPTSGKNGPYWGCYKGWQNCKGSQNWSTYINDPDVFVEERRKN